MNAQLKQRIAKVLVNGDKLISRAESEARYPVRQLPAGAEVLRVPPSPTGFVHIGTIYAGLINERVAHQSGGVFILRIEDTDKKREIKGSLDQIIRAFKEFGLEYDEGPEIGGSYAPYLQSERAAIYLGYAIDLLQNDRAYPCFATPEELQAATADQHAKKLRPGYYGEWALWRDKSDDDINAALDANRPFVLRFRSQGSHDQRVTYQDIFKGKMEVPQNDLDVPLIKSDETRLPTYHLAHVVDDYLMRVTKVFRSDEWLPSTALHIELSQALGLDPFTYGHFAPISVIDKNGGKRKLSKRKDDEADVQYWLKAGYPVDAVKAYLLGLANSNFEDWYRANPNKSLTDFLVSLEKLAASRAPLLDIAKLEDYCKDYIASLPQADFEQAVLRSATGKLKAAFEADPSYATKVLSVERGGDKPRKDLAKWSDVAEVYGYFFDEEFEVDFKGRVNEQLKDIPASVQDEVTKEFIKTYAASDDQATWFDKLKSAAEACQFATDNKAFKATPEKFKGNLADFARILRVKLTGKNQTPDLWTIMGVMGQDRVKTRLNQ